MDRLQDPHRLAEMSGEYIANVIVFLEKDVKYFYYASNAAGAPAVAFAASCEIGS